MQPQAWKTLSSRDVIRDRWVRLRADRCEIAPGRIVDSYYVLEEPSWVHAVAFDAQQAVLLVRQYRHAIREFSWELPGGAADAGEDLLVTAQRELREEAGAVGDGWRHLGGYATNPGRHDNRVHGFVTENVRIAHAQSLDETEAIECRFFTLAEVLEMIRLGTFSNVMHVALFYRALAETGRLQIPGAGDKPLA